MHNFANSRQTNTIQIDFHHLNEERQQKIKNSHKIAATMAMSVNKFDI